MGERITLGGYAHMNPKQEISLTVTKKQLSLSGKVQTHDTIKDKTGESGLSIKNFLSLDFNDL
jgi:hypothetical protein